MSDGTSIEWTHVPGYRSATWNPISGCTRPLRARKPTCYFVNSTSDLFHEKVPLAAIDWVFGVIARCPQHIFIVLSKRSERMKHYFTDPNGYDGVCSEARTGLRWPLPNVWLGVSAEDQKAADERIPDLLETPAAKRIVSVEPMLGPVDLHLKVERGPAGATYTCAGPHLGIKWVICGGESGPGARPMHPDWAHSLREQCSAADVPFFFKQWGVLFE